MLSLYIFVFITGAAIGSFLNVVIYRVPREMSIVTPRSTCPVCSYKIRWYENIPILSYAFLKGRCSNCKTKIPIKYVLIEIITGLIAYRLFPQSLDPYLLLEFVYFFSVACVLLCHFVIDIEHQLLPDKINLYFLAITIPYVAVSGNYILALLGGAIGFLGPLLVTWLFYKIKGQVGLGGGDIKLFGVLGLILGPVGIMHNVFMSALLGSIISITLMLFNKMDKNSPMAFGPYIIFAAVLQIYAPSYFKMINPFVIQ